MKNKSTKRALLASVMAMLLCFTMLLGTTFAWFTDSATTGSNVIQAGTLDIVLEYWDGDSWEDAEGQVLEFIKGGNYHGYVGEVLWEPGCTYALPKIRVRNEGNLAAKVLFKVNGITGDEKLLEAITFETKVENIPETLKTGSAGATFTAMEGNSYELFYGTPDGTVMMDWTVMAKGHTSQNTGHTDTSAEFTISGHMDENADNEYQGLKIEGVSITVVATQEIYEYDSFEREYDKEAAYPEINTVDTWDGTVDISWYNNTDTEFTLSTAEQFAGLAALVDGTATIPADAESEITLPVTFDGKIVKLDADVDLGSLPFSPIGHYKNGQSFNGTFDGQGHTISNLYEQSNLDDKNGGWLYEGEYYGLFAYTDGATIKNVTVAEAYISSGRNEAAGVVGYANNTSFSDITVSNTTLIAYNNSAGGVAAECYGDCSFTNITVDEDTVIGPLWGTYDVRLGGVVGMVKSSDKVSFSNITVACQLDAINDVAANYQHWLYRYSGMLIGQVDGVNGVADPTGYVTCENVTVIYGDWVNYHYCEDADLGAGSYNGPGEYKYARVEAGTGTDGIDLSACEHSADESHNVLIVFDQLFGGGQGVKGLATYEGVNITYPASYNPEG